jgi:sporulation protein YlmC with PRC-barrel domain
LIFAAIRAAMLSARALEQVGEHRFRELADRAPIGIIVATPKQGGVDVNTYVIRREKAWASPEELEATAGRSKDVAESDFPEDISWIRSYVIAEPGGTLGTVCIYQASNIDAVREHAKRVDMPADEVLEVADTVIIRPDPEPQPSA